MKRSSQLHTDAWLLKGIHSVPGALRLAGGRLSFTAFGSGTLGGRQLRRLESDTGRAGLAKRLGDDQRTVVFDVPLAEVQDVIFPWYYFSGGVKFTVNGVRYRFSFAQPANSKLPSEDLDLSDISRARRSGKAWKTVFINSSR